MTARSLNWAPDWTAKVFALLLLACAPVLSACQTDAPGGPSAQAAPQEASKDTPPTRREAALICWSSVDKAHPTMGLDQRADLVTKCINEKTNAAQQPAAVAPKPPKSKT